MRGRWSKHLRSLLHGSHQNFHLQQAWDKYGEDNFKFLVLELIMKSELLRAEQAWIDSSGCTDRNVGFNIYKVAGSPGNMFAQVWEGFRDPNGEEIIITNLSDFCRQHNLDFPSMHRLAKGKSKLKSFKGWTHRNSVRQREYVKTYDGFIAPDGRPAGIITNLAAFCRQHELDNTHMVAVANGRIRSHRGWTHRTGRPKPSASYSKTYHNFINSEGQRVTITNLKLFSQEHGLNLRRMYEVAGEKNKAP